MAISSNTMRGISLFCRVIETISALIVLGITAWAVETSKTVTVIYSLVIACLTVFYALLLFVFAFFSSKKTIFHVISTMIDLFLAFFWIAAFVLLANNFNDTGCRVNHWHGILVCSRQHTVEAFAFIAFFFTLVAAIFSALTVYAMAKERREDEPPHREKTATPSTVAETIPETHASTEQTVNNVV
ncbi:hypothetical protein BGW36DRAFT_423427 [Talaromyces proteolyticus]|uniref:MARVEL domain-containing protein n=1 Tax=Talaromyces proteolyticus TaxID=1131652 RepID=A0AAD4L0B3_9EURO|nr:uncharacterized protein BGW36DRAFT_423427 [Talaromyces proteolyticus]KAH8703883.1 hypothetical protein BGW36DRAFT_423427 [Talaromyces proteolyticus]